MNQEQGSSWWRNRNLLLALVSLLVYILVLVIIIDSMPGTDRMRIWELIGVLIVPGALLVTAIWLNNAQIRREETVTNQHAQDEALRQYLDQMCNLLIDERLREQPSESGAYTLAQAWTMATLLGLDENRKRRVLKFIAQLNLINRDNPLVSLKSAALDDADLHEVTLLTVSLREADLRGADLTGANLMESDLTWADLRGADLRGAVLTHASLAYANLLPYDRRRPAQLNAPHLLNGSDLSEVDARIERSRLLNLSRLGGAGPTLTRLDEANLQGAALSDAFLRWTSLRGADLRGADLRGADLRGADLRGADLRGARVTQAQLDDAFLEGATVPEELKYSSSA